MPTRGEPEWCPADITVRRSSDDKRTEVVINTNALDTYGTVIEPEGVQLDRYRRNPIVLINHDMWAVAGNSTVSLRNGQLVATMEDSDWDLDDPFIAGWYRKVKKGFVRAASIRFIPIEWKEEKNEDNGFFRITKWELAEWSYVSVPANGEAIVTARSAPPETHALSEVRSAIEELKTTLEQLRTADAAPPAASASDAGQEPADEAATARVPADAALPQPPTGDDVPPAVRHVALSDLRTLISEASQARQRHALNLALRQLGRA